MPDILELDRVPNPSTHPLSPFLSQTPSYWLSQEGIRESHFYCLQRGFNYIQGTLRPWSMAGDALEECLSSGLSWEPQAGLCLQPTARQGGVPALLWWIRRSDSSCAQPSHPNRCCTLREGISLFQPLPADFCEIPSPRVLCHIPPDLKPSSCSVPECAAAPHPQISEGKSNSSIKWRTTVLPRASSPTACADVAPLPPPPRTLELAHSRQPGSGGANSQIPCLANS